MNESHITGWIASAMQFAVAAYALRLNRRFGTARVGWSLCGAFSLLACLQLIQSTVSFGASMDSALKINVTYALISFLLLIGMVHVETMLKERARMDRLEKELRASLEAEVKSKTAHLNRAIEELMREIDQTKRMTAIIESSGTEIIRKRAANPATNVFDDLDDEVTGDLMPMKPATTTEETNEQFLAGIIGGDLVAQF